MAVPKTINAAIRGYNIQEQPNDKDQLNKAMFRDTGTARIPRRDFKRDTNLGTAKSYDGVKIHPLPLQPSFDLWPMGLLKKLRPHIYNHELQREKTARETSLELCTTPSQNASRPGPPHRVFERKPELHDNASKKTAERINDKTLTSRRLSSLVLEEYIIMRSSNSRFALHRSLHNRFKEILSDDTPGVTKNEEIRIHATNDGNDRYEAGRTGAEPGDLPRQRLRGRPPTILNEGNRIHIVDNPRKRKRHVQPAAQMETQRGISGGVEGAETPEPHLTIPQGRGTEELIELYRSRPRNTQFVEPAIDEGTLTNSVNQSSRSSPDHHPHSQWSRLLRTSPDLPPNFTPPTSFGIAVNRSTYIQEAPHTFLSTYFDRVTIEMGPTNRPQQATGHGAPRASDHTRSSIKDTVAADVVETTVVNSSHSQRRYLAADPAPGATSQTRSSSQLVVTATPSHTQSRSWVSSSRAQEDEWKRLERKIVHMKLNKSPFLPKDIRSYYQHKCEYQEWSIAQYVRRIRETVPFASFNGWLDSVDTEATVASDTRQNSGGTQILKYSGKCMNGQSYRDGFSTVLSVKTNFRPLEWKTEMERKGEADWPSIAEMRWDGDDRLVNAAYGRFTPVPRSEAYDWQYGIPTGEGSSGRDGQPLWVGNGPVPWQQRKYIKPHLFDTFWGSVDHRPDEEIIFDKVQEIPQHEEASLIGFDLLRATQED